MNTLFCQNVVGYILHEISNTVSSLNINLELLDSGNFSNDLLTFLKEIRLHHSAQIEYFRYLYSSSMQEKSIGDLIRLSQDFLKYYPIKILLLNAKFSKIMINSNYGKYLLIFINIVAPYICNNAVIGINCLKQRELKHKISILISQESFKKFSLQSVASELTSPFLEKHNTSSGKVLACYLQNLREFSKTLEQDCSITIDNESIEFSFCV